MPESKIKSLMAKTKIAILNFQEDVKGYDEMESSEENLELLQTDLSTLADRLQDIIRDTAEAIEEFNTDEESEDEQNEVTFEDEDNSPLNDHYGNDTLPEQTTEESEDDRKFEV